jgi:protein gp37
MKLYHGSITPGITMFKPQTPDFPDGIHVPEAERQTGIYLAKNIDMALAMGIRPQGETRVNVEEKTISLELPETFNSDQAVYIYEFEILEDQQCNLQYLEDGWQYLMKNTELTPVRVMTFRSGDVKKYFTALNF